MTEAELAAMEAKYPARDWTGDEVLALVAEVRRLRGILTAIIYASDGCVGHRDCNHSITPWKDARHALWPESYDAAGKLRER